MVYRIKSEVELLKQLEIPGFTQEGPGDHILNTNNFGLAESMHSEVFRDCGKIVPDYYHGMSYQSHHLWNWTVTHEPTDEDKKDLIII